MYNVENVSVWRSNGDNQGQEPAIPCAAASRVSAAARSGVSPWAASPSSSTSPVASHRVGSSRFKIHGVTRGKQYKIKETDIETIKYKYKYKMTEKFRQEKIGEDQKPRQVENKSKVADTIISSNFLCEPGKNDGPPFKKTKNPIQKPLPSKTIKNHTHAWD